jgi:hypothetical protein
MKTSHRLGRLGVAMVAVGCSLTLAQCSWFTPPPPAPTLSPSASTTSPARTITDANLITASDLPAPIGGGELIEHHRNAQTLDQLSICQPQPLETLGASAIKSRSFQARYPAGDRPFPRSSLDNKPESYAAVLQFAEQSAAERAKSIYQGWVASCALQARTRRKASRCCARASTGHPSLLSLPRLKSPRSSIATMNHRVRMPISRASG